MSTTEAPVGAAAMVSLRGVSRHYGAVKAVDGVDLDIAPGEAFGLIGRNGAGKTTLFKMMLGLLAPSGGRISVDGVDVASGAFRAVRRHIGYLPENVVFYDNLSGLETLAFFARLKGVPTARCAPLLAEVGLAQAGSRRVREYSKGMRQRLGFAQALLGEPRLLFLDEPTTGLDPDGVREFHRMLQALKARGTTIVMTSHILAEIQARVDRIAVVAGGRMRAVGTVGALREQLDLPLCFELTLAPAALAHARDLLGALPLLSIVLGADRVTLECRRAVKMQVIETIARLDGAVIDVDVREPSLEDVFFGLAE